MTSGDWRQNDFNFFFGNLKIDMELTAAWKKRSFHIELWEFRVSDPNSSCNYPVNMRDY